MKTTACTLGATAFAAYTGSLGSYLDALACSGYNCLELRNFIGTEGEIRLSQLGTVRERLAGSGWRTTVHAPVDRNLASSDQAERAWAYNEACKALQVAKDLGSLVVVVHGGTHPAKAEGLPLAYDQLARLSARAQELGVTLALENAEVGDQRLFRYPEAFALVADLPLSFVIDIGHAFTLGLTLEDFLPVVAGRLVEVHLHDNDGRGDWHWPLGVGAVPITRTLDLLQATGFTGVYTVEVKDLGGLAASAEYLRARGSCWEGQK